jgi:hypothetical protein
VDSQWLFSFVRGSFAEPHVLQFAGSLAQIPRARQPKHRGPEYRLSYDVDPSAGQNWMSIDPLAAIFDNSFGNNSTANGAGVEPVSIRDRLFVSNIRPMEMRQDRSARARVSRRFPRRGHWGFIQR